MAFEYFFGGGPYHSGRRQEVFQKPFNCFSTAISGKENINDGDKVLLPPSALDQLAQMNVEYPMLFEVVNPIVHKSTHCGVLEFSAEEGRCYMPFWMMQNLFLEEGAMILLKNVSLRKASYVKFQAQSVDFLEVTNPRAVLEVALRKFTCLTVGDMIRIQYAGRDFYLEVKELKPDRAVSIVETDCNVDFDEPVGYKDSKYARAEQQPARSTETSGKTISGGGGGGEIAPDKLGTSASESTRVVQRAQVGTEGNEGDGPNFKPFSGSARRIDGKVISSSVEGPAPPLPPSTSSKLNSLPPTPSSATLPSSTGSSKLGSSSSSSSSSTSAFSGAGMKLGGGSSSTGTNSSSSFQTSSSFKSRIGDKYSKTAKATSAFTGPANKLT